MENKRRRSAVFQVWLAGLLAIALLCLAPKTSFGEEKDGLESPSLAAQSAVLIDGETGRVLYAKDAEQARPMASTTKIMTCIVALENASLDDTVEVSDYAASMPDVQLGIRKGETYRLRDLLYSLMLESHNDSAVAVAEHVGGSVEGFAAMMNQKARDIGCYDTCFITPNGLDAAVQETGEIHSTTAKDLAEILRYCILLSPKREEFLEITRAPSYAFSSLEGGRSFSCINHNALLTSMEGALSGKTGFTNKAGYCYVGAVKKGEKTFIAALLACGWPPHKLYKWQDMRKLIRYGDTNYEYREIKKEALDFEKVFVSGGIGTETGLTVVYTAEPLRVLMRKDEPVRIKKSVARVLSAPVEEGMTAGQVDYYVGEDLVASYPVPTTGRVRKWNYDFCIKTLLNCFFF